MALTKKYILAHDLGTGGDKCLLINEDGEILSTEFKEYETLHPKPGYAEQRPNDWWEAVRATTSQTLKNAGIDGGDLSCLAFTGQMMTCIPVDERGNLIGKNIMTWGDKRSRKQAESIKKHVNDESWYKITGGGMGWEMYLAPRIMWIKENEPSIFNEAYKFLPCSKDYFVSKLTGNLITDYSCASGTAIFELKNRKWSRELIEVTEIPSEKLPKVCESTDIVGMVSESAADDLNIKSGIPVIAGAGDPAATAVGSGVTKSGRSNISIGSTAWVSVAGNEPILNYDKFKTLGFCHVVPGKYISQFDTCMAGSAYRWVRDQICSQEKECAEGTGVSPYKIMDMEASSIPAGSNNLFFLPGIHGDSNSGGSFIGLNLEHKKKHLIRSVLEGVAFETKLFLEAFENLGVDIGTIRLIGGGAESNLWRQIFADIYNKKVMTLNTGQSAAALGVAFTGGVGLGIFEDFDMIDRVIESTGITYPNPKNTKRYNKMYEVFKKIYDAFIPIYKTIGSTNEDSNFLSI